MNNSNYVLCSLNGKLVKVKLVNLMIRRETKNHNWPVQKCQNLNKSVQPTYRIVLNRKERVLNRRIRIDIKTHNWLIRKYMDRVKLEKQPGPSRDIVENL